MRYITLAFATLLLTPVEPTGGAALRAGHTDGDHDYGAVGVTVGTRWLGPDVAVWYGPYLGGYGLWPLEPYYYYGPRIGFGITVVPAFLFHRRH